MRRSSLIAAALAALVCAGCGGFGGGEVTERITQSPLLTERQVERQPVGSPQRAVFEWWRALQFKNAVEASRYFKSSLGLTPRKLYRYLPSAEPAVANRPRLFDVETSGDRAIVRLLLEKTTTSPNGRADRARKAQAFNLVREHGDWKLSDNYFLAGTYRTYRLFSAPLREKGKQKK